MLIAPFSSSKAQAGSVALDDEQDVSRNLIPQTAEGSSAASPILGPDGQPIQPSIEADTADAAANATKKRKRRPKSPSLPPVKARPAQPTIRLTFEIPRQPPKGGLMINLRSTAKGLGQIVADFSDDEGSEAAEEEPEANSNAKNVLSASTTALLGIKTGAAKKKDPSTRKRKRVQDRDEGYDKEDPFVDDSELHLDLVKTCGIPEKDGFYIWPGELPIKLDDKGKGTRAKRAAPVTLTSQTNQTENKVPARKRAKTNSAQDSGPSQAGTPNATASTSTPKNRAKPKSGSTAPTPAQMVVASPSNLDGPSPTKSGVAVGLQYRWTI